MASILPKSVGPALMKDSYNKHILFLQRKVDGIAKPIQKRLPNGALDEWNLVRGTGNTTQKFPSYGSEAGTQAWFYTLVSGNG